jgi:phosphoglycerate kinase
MKRIDQINVSGKKVFLRVDFNVPLDKDLKVADDKRIKKSLLTINYLLENNAALIIATHLGRPKSKEDFQFSVEPVANHLESILGKKVKFAKDCIGDDTKKLVSEMKQGEIIVLENLRYYKEEKKNDKEFAKKLAELCDVYINEAFAVSHRANASVEAITQFVSESAAGFLLLTEIEYFESAMKSPKRPFTAVIGGLKVSDKLKAIKNILLNVDNVIIGGAMANTFLKAKGIDMAASVIEDDLIEEAKSIMKIAKKNNIGFYLPEDVVSAKEISENAQPVFTDIDNVPENHMALDIGAKTIQKFSEALSDSKTIMWNGPMGVFEKTPFAEGTIKVAKSIAESGALTIAGGGDTGAAASAADVEDKISYISTGGGAFLALMEGKTLPAVDALSR